MLQQFYVLGTTVIAAAAALHVNQAPRRPQGETLRVHDSTIVSNGPIQQTILLDAGVDVDDIE